MNNQEQIGLIAWGLKLGKQVFFHSNFINPEEAAMVNALEDIRGVVNFTQPNLQFYSLEFTEKFRIYTAYRTIFDWVGREGYLALSVLVPHTYQLKEAHTFRLLKDLLGTYETNYIDERHRIKNQRENPDLFFSLINSERLQPMAQRETLMGNNSNRYAYLLYNNDTDLINYFDSPYRREYNGYKEVFFLLQSQHRLRPSENATKLNLPPKVISYTLDIVFQDEKGNNVQPDQWSAQVENTNYKTLTISDLNLNDQVVVSAEKAGYSTINQTISLKTQFFGQETRKSKTFTFSRKQVNVKIWFLDKRSIPLRNVLLSISVNERKLQIPGVVNENYEFRAYVDDSIHVVARQEKASKDTLFRIDSFHVKNDIFDINLCLEDLTGFSAVAKTEPEHKQKGWGQSPATTAADPKASVPKKGLEPRIKAALWVGALILFIIGVLVLPYYLTKGSSPMGNGSLQSRKLHTVLRTDSIKLAGKDENLRDSLEKWQLRYKSLAVEIDESNRNIFDSNRTRIDMLSQCLADAKLTYQEADKFIEAEPFGAGKMKLAEEHLNNIEKLAETTCAYMTRAKQNDSKQLLEKIISIERDILTFKNGLTSAKITAQKKLKASAQDSIFSSQRRESLKKY